VEAMHPAPARAAARYHADGGSYGNTRTAATGTTLEAALLAHEPSREPPVLTTSTDHATPIDLTGTSFLELLGDAPPAVDLAAPFTIGRPGTTAVTIEGRVALAPMAGVSVQAFRRQ